MMTIKDARIKYNLTQTKLSELTGVPVRTIQNWEGGRRSCPDYVLDLILFKLEKIFE